MKQWGWVMATAAALVACESAPPEPAPAHTLVSVDAEPAGANCSSGGVAVRWGDDSNASGALDPSEVSHTEYRCNPPKPGTPRVLVRRATEPRGPNCEHGGTVVRSGVDADGSGMLDDGEVSETVYVCDAPDAPPQVLSRVEHVGPGTACENGGTAVYSGRDADRDGALGTDEIESSAFVCEDATASAEVEVGSGNSHTCARKANGTVWCWGDNLVSQLGISSFSHPVGPVPIIGVTGATAISVGSDHACAVVEGGAVWCWGDNRARQLGDAERRSAARPVEGVPSMTRVAAGGDHTCGLAVDGTVWCWGSDSAGQSGHGAIDTSVAPVQVGGLTDVIGLSSGLAHTCALRSGGEVLCWGAQLGGGVDGETCGFSGSCHRAPTLVAGLPAATAIAAGTMRECAITETHDAWCWGFNPYGALGDGTNVDRPVPTQVAGLTDIREIRTGNVHSCATRNDGSLWCWGNNAFGQVGAGTVGPSRFLPSQVAGDFGLTGLSVGTYHTCGLRDGAPSCWGYNRSGQVGPIGRVVPTEVLVDVADFSAGNHGACAVITGGSVWCWGSFNFGEQLGAWDVVPVPKLGLPDARSVAAGATHACIAALDGSVWCWGGNSYGELGDVSLGARDVPVRVAGIDDAVAIYAGGFQSCAQVADGSLWCWGAEGEQFGAGRPPTKMLATLTSVALGDLHGCAVDAANVAWCWGNNEQHQIDGGFEDVKALTQVRSNVAAVSAGIDSSCAADLDGSLWCWGDFDRTVKKKVVGPFTAVESSYFHTCVLRPDDTVACFGFNSHGQLGDGTFDSRSTPVAVPGLTDVVQVSAGYQQTCARRKEGSLWCWGANDAGQIGDGGLTERITRPVGVEL